MDDERPIEQLLKKYARQKREAAVAAPQLHEAARRTLQAEVMRQYPQTRTAGFVWPSWWPRFALGLGVLMLGAALAVYVFTPERGATPRADTYASLGPAEKDKVAEPNDHLAAPTEALAPRTELARAPQPDVTPSLASPAPDTISHGAPAPPADATTTRTTAVATAPSAPPSSTGTFAAALPSSAIRNVQMFNNSATAPEFKNNTLATQVMASFKVEQAGNVIRIIDQDGSVYTGQLQPVLERAPASRTVGGSGSGSDVSRSFAFQAIGMNRSLKEPVTFSGNLAVQPQNTRAPSGRKENRPRGVASVTVGDAGALLNSRISGKAQVGANELITVEAVAVDVPR